jgi:hypothetical protein
VPELRRIAGGPRAISSNRVAAAAGVLLPAAGPRRAESLAEWASREEALKTPLDVGDVKGTLKRYMMTPGAEGAELRAAHGAAARQYSKVYGYTVATFVVAALVDHERGRQAGTGLCRRTTTHDCRLGRGAL